jgi:uncharacterized protein (DUF427 family)
MSTIRTPARVEASHKRIRAYLGGRPVVDTAHPLLVWEHLRFPTYYLPVADTSPRAFEDSDAIVRSPSRGDAQVLNLRVGDRVVRNAALRYDASPVPEIAGHIRIDWSAVDAWFEEDEEVFIHPRSPDTRIDILPSSRLVRVELDGTVIAESTNTRMLFETYLPTRFYFPKTDVRMDLLERSTTTSGCPYKGTAEYWSARIGGTVYGDVAWSYRTALPESQKITGLVAFWHADIYVDDVLQEG